MEEEKTEVKKEAKFGKKRTILITFIIIIIGAVIAALFYLPMPSSWIHSYLPERCAFTEGIKCVSFEIISNQGDNKGAVNFNIMNIGKTTKSFSFSASNEACIDPLGNTLETVPCSAKCDVQPNGGVNIKPKEIMNVTCTFDKIFENQTKHRIEIKTDAETVSGLIYAISK